MIEAPLYVDAFTLLNWNWRFWGDDTVTVMAIMLFLLSAFRVVRFEPGDQLRVKCTFDNVEGRWGPGVAPMDTNWGESSTEEMCVANILSSE